MGNYNNSSSRNRAFIICFIIVAIISLIVCIIGKNALEKSASKFSENYTGNNAVTTVSGESDTAYNKPETTSVSDDMQENENLITEIKYDSSVVKKDINTVMAATIDKECRIDLKEFASSNDIIRSFSYTFSAADGSSSLGVIKLGFGVSVDDECPYSEKNWYEMPGEYSGYSDDSSFTVKWDIPEEIREHIDIENGNVLFGYWWTDNKTVRLEKIVCDKTTVCSVPVKGQRNKFIDDSINMDLSDSVPDQFEMMVSDLLKDGQKPQSIYMHIGTEDESFGETEYSIGMASGVRSETFVLDSNSNSANINWLIPESVRESLDYSDKFVLTFHSGKTQNIFLDQIIVDYSVD